VTAIFPGKGHAFFSFLLSGFHGNRFFILFLFFSPFFPFLFLFFSFLIVLFLFFFF